jgi:hypothetical protein
MNVMDDSANGKMSEALAENTAWRPVSPASLLDNIVVAEMFMTLVHDSANPKMSENLAENTASRPVI